MIFLPSLLDHNESDIPVDLLIAFSYDFITEKTILLQNNFSSRRR